jgi:hypothetical protein
VRNKFADKAAGWAHSVLFAAELPQFRSLLPTTLQQKMKIYSEQRKLLNKEKKLQSQTASSALLLSASSSILSSLSVPSSSLIKKRVRMKTMKATRNIIVNYHDINRFYGSFTVTNMNKTIPLLLLSSSLLST